MQYILVDIADRVNFYPFTLTQSLASCRVGIFTFQERWEQYTKETCGIYTEAYLQNLYEPSNFLQDDNPVFFINVTCIPTHPIMEAIQSLKEEEKLMSGSGKWIATKTKKRDIATILMGEKTSLYDKEVSFLYNQLALLKFHVHRASSFRLLAMLLLCKERLCLNISN